MNRLLDLGTGRLAALGVAPKAARLDAAAARGLPVPRGLVVPDGADVDAAAADIAARFDTPLAVRSAFSAEDTSGRSMAGHFHTALDVDPSPGPVAAAIRAVLASGTSDIRRDVLVMELVDAGHAGVAFSEPGWQDDLVNVVTGQGEQLVSGSETGDRLDLPRLGRWERPTAAEPWPRRLQELLRDTRRSEGDEPWDIEWADDGTTCWLLQVRPITAPPTRDELFTLANHREILPDPPSVFVSSVIMANGRRVGGPGGLLREATARRGYFEMFDGRPYINQSITTDLVRGLGLPSALVNASLGGDDVDDIGPAPLRIALSLPTLARLGAGQARAVSRSRTVAAGLARPDPEPASFDAAISAFADDHLALVEEMGNLVSAMALPLAVLRRVGVLDTHFADLQTPGTRIMSDLRAVATLAADTPGGVDALDDGRIPDDPAVRRAWNRWLREHGHRGRFESDLAEPRFHEAPETTIRLAAALATRPDSAPNADSGSHSEIEPHSGSASIPATPRWKTVATKPLWFVGRRALVAREELRTQAMRGFDVHRRAMLRLAAAAADDGRLPETGAVWDLSADELRAVDAGEVVTVERLAARRSEIAAHATIDVPEVRRRFGAVATTGEPDGTGIPLHPGLVEGSAWVLDTPSTELPDGFDPATTILVARSIDAGWVPTFGLVAGVAVDIGGDLSHGSIILRELGLPSITNTRGLTKLVTTGERVRLDAAAGALRAV